MNRLVVVLALLATYLCTTPLVFAASSEITTFTSNTLQIITLIAGGAATLFLIIGGYGYITSSGNPETLENSKRIIKNALLGLLLILGSGIFVSLLRTALQPASSTNPTAAISLQPIQSAEPAEGLAQVLIDAVSGFMENIVQSAITPILNGILGYLTTTPSVLNNSVIFDFWLVTLGIVDSLFVLVVALLGLQLMSASTFGFEEVRLNQLLPRIGLAFLGANISLFLADYVILTCNALVKAILDSTGGLQQAWLEHATNPVVLVAGTTPLITLIFFVIFLIVAIVLLLMYISRLILISLGAVLSPFIFLLWAIPKTAGFAEMAVKSYFVTVFIVFVHVVTIQLAASFLTLPENSTNSLIAIATAIGLFFTLLKTPSLMMQLVQESAHTGVIQKLGGQIMNVMSTSKSTSATSDDGKLSVIKHAAKLPRKVVHT
jgi:hypothetical protein